MTENNTTLTKKLTTKEVEKICSLERYSQEKKGIYFKLDPQSFSAENEAAVHILHYENNELTAYMLLSSFDEKELECSTILGENKSIFSYMCRLAIQNATERNIENVLFIIDQNDDFLIKQMQSLNFKYSFAEHRMIFNKTKFIPNKSSDIIIRDAVYEDQKAIDMLYNQGFRASPDSFISENLPPMDMKHVKVAIMKNELIGTMKVENCNGVVGLYGFVLDRKYRGKGFGKQIIKSIIQDILTTNFEKLYLEVDTENMVAIGLYQSLGFEHEVTFNYYECTL